jgi:hypothetical protein
MAEKTQTRETRESSDRRTNRAGPFKPIAIPALAAAVSAGAGRPDRKSARREELPAILRQDAFVD